MGSFFLSIEFSKVSRMRIYLKNTSTHATTFWCVLLLFQWPLMAQQTTGYQRPPQAIEELVNAPVTPSVSFSKTGDLMLVLEAPGYASLEDISHPELRIGGIRINPASSGPSRASSFEKIQLKNIRTGEEKEISNLPENPKLSNISFSDDEKYIAFTHRSADGISL